MNYHEKTVAELAQLSPSWARAVRELHEGGQKMSERMNRLFFEAITAPNPKTDG